MKTSQLMKKICAVAMAVYMLRFGSYKGFINN